MNQIANCQFDLRPIVLVVFMTGLVGCGNTGIYPVEGKVVYSDGSAATDLAGCHVEFEAIDGKLDGRGVSAEGAIQADGSFRLTTIKANDGALVGNHRVLIANPLVEDDIAVRPTPVDPKYASYGSSGLTAVVEPKTNQVRLEIERFKKPATPK